MISVMGATGNTGGMVSKLLLEGGSEVKALGRSADRLAGLVAGGAEAAVGEATDESYLADAFRGAEAIYTLIPTNMQAEEYGAFQDQVGEAIVGAIRESGVQRVVFLSSVGADQPSGTGPIAGLHRQEERLRSLQGVDVLSLRPGFFFENFVDMVGLIKHQGINGSAIGSDTTLPMIATRDIAAAAAQALAAREFSGFVVRELLGPQDLDMTEATRIIGESIGRPDLPYVQFSYEDSEAALVQMGAPAGLAALYTEMTRAFNEGRVRSLEGRSAANTTPTSLATFAVEVLAPAYEAA